MRSRNVLVLLSLPLAGQQLFRLGHQVSPTHYSVNLTVTPGQQTFQGVIDIDLKFSNPTNQFWMNATALQISRAEIRMGNRPSRRRWS